MSQLGKLASWAAILGLSTLSFVGLMTIFGNRRRVDRSNQQFLAKIRSDMDELRREVKKRDEALAALRQERSKEAEGAGLMIDALSRLKGELAAAQGRTKDLETELGGLQQQNRIQADQLQRQALELQAAIDESHNLRTQHSRSLEMLEKRTLEAQALVPVTDSASVSDVVDMVARLNSKISRIAISLENAFEFRKNGEGTEEEEEVSEALAQAGEIMGERMIQLLRSTDHSEDATLVQLAFRTVISGISEWVVESWYFEEPEMDHFLQKVYLKVQESEDQAVGGRWRSLTRRYVRRIAQEKSEIPLPLMSQFLGTFVSVLILARCTQSSPQIQETITTRFMETLEDVGKLALRISQTLGEEIMSKEVEAVYISPSVVFNPEIMGNLSGDAEQDVVGEPILCTTDLGLVCATRETEDAGPRWKETVLLKPRVLLESVVNKNENGDGQT